MGYCIDKEWRLALNEGVTFTELLAALNAVELPPWAVTPITGDYTEGDEVCQILAAVNEDGDLYAEEDTITGSTYGKSYYEAKEAIFPVLARLVSGTIDCHTEEDDFFRMRFRDGTVTQHAGEIVYPSDRGAS